MRFRKPNYHEVYLANFKNDNWCHEVHIATITPNLEIIIHAPIELFFHNRRYGVIIGYVSEGDWVSKNFMSIRTKKQEYAGWPPISTPEDFERIIKLMVEKEKFKGEKYRENPQKYQFWKEYIYQ